MSTLGIRRSEAKMGGFKATEFTGEGGRRGPLGLAPDSGPVGAGEQVAGGLAAHHLKTRLSHSVMRQIQSTAMPTRREA